MSSGTRIQRALEPCFQRLDESLVRLELRRYRRAMLGVKLPGIYGAGIFVVAWILGPFLLGVLGVVGGGALTLSAAGSWQGLLIAASGALAAVAAYLRSQLLWTQQQRSHGLESWLLSRQSPAQVLWATVAMPTLWGLLLVALPVGVAVFTGVLWQQATLGLLPALLLVAGCSFFGAAVGALYFFIQLKLTPNSLQGAILLVVLGCFLGTWLWIESRENGWQRSWAEHPARLGRAAAVLAPTTHLYSACSPSWWDQTLRPSIHKRASAIPAAFGSFVLICLAGFGAATVALKSYLRYIDDPSRLDSGRRPRAVESGGQEFYWQGFQNPIWTRDVRTRLRHKETADIIGFTAITVAAGGFIPLVLTVKDLGDPLATASAARDVFFWLTMTLVGLATLLGPGLTSESIAHDREQGALELLIASPLHPKELLLGKWLGAMSILLLLISPSLPLFGLCYVFHGADSTQVLSVYLLVIGTLGVAAAIGLTQSAINSSPGMAKFHAYGVTAGFVAVPGGPFWAAAAFAAPSADLRNSLMSGAAASVIIGVIFLGVLILFWGNAVEELEYLEH